MKLIVFQRHFYPLCYSFFKQKTFGNAKVPSGWIIVAAGNPAEYNRSVRDFDVVTLDRVKYIEVELRLCHMERICDKTRCA